MATLLANQPVPSGRRVAILTNAGGPGILAADACEANGLTLPALNDGHAAELRSFLPAATSVANPVDMIASATPHHSRTRAHRHCCATTSSRQRHCHLHPAAGHQSRRSRLRRSGGRASSPQVSPSSACSCARRAPATLAPIPCYAFPESAALALARVAAGEWRARPIETVPQLARFDRDGIRAIVERVLARRQRVSGCDEVTTLLTAAGDPLRRVASGRHVRRSRAGGELDRLSRRPQGPRTGTLAQDRRRAVALNLASATEVKDAFEDFTARLSVDMSSVLVQEMLATGVEIIVGAIHNPSFQPCIPCGTGGVLVDIFADTSGSRLHPLTDLDAHDMVNELRGARLLRGFPRRAGCRRGQLA